MKSINLIRDLKIYNAHVLAYPEIGNTEIERDTFESDTGLIFYSEKRLAFTPVSFVIEFKGGKDEIRKNRNKLSKELELAKVTFNDEVYYKGRFLAESVDTRYYFQNVTYKGKAIAMLNVQEIVVPINKTIKIYNNGNLPTPCRLCLNGSGDNINIKGFDDDINIKKLLNEIIIDSERGVYSLEGNSFIDIKSFPYIEDKVEILVSGSGDFICVIEFEGRVLC
ncbi:hypothetical protein HV819_02275 [Anaerococcus sp. AGMB00486]|uniref:Phage tail protein n=2 Tax=Anaerococcus TaxID=165779 RepID=A0ABX2N807_9FIRM|nr:MULTISPECIES: hypothetical protein [Anaerococcus]MSS77376.1 hypothetical protein [Anaerococcus porci]NVF10823.1 hypothetical protein [Anaerococcus faecalis]